MERHTVDFPTFLEQHRPIVDAGQPPGERRLAIDRLCGHELSASRPRNLR